MPTYATLPDDFPALVVTKEDHDDVFYAFQKSFEQLWHDSKSQQKRPIK
jgi:hypothetical protein